MDGTNPKVSFIPKGSLVREESFLERRRPRSIIGIIAVIVFILSVGSYAGLYYYETLLSQEVSATTDEIKQTQKDFGNAPQVANAKLFQARADLARELLDAHTIVSPLFAFISHNTLSNIMYDKFSYKANANGGTLELSGEAPTYAALAYQEDVLSADKKDLLGYSVKDIVLTNFSTINFTLDLTFTPDFLSYLKNNTGGEISTPQTMPDNSLVLSNTSSPILNQPTIATTSAPSSNIGSVVSTQASPSVIQNAISFLKSLWTRFKFW